jgi:WD40 repeat protein
VRCWDIASSSLVATFVLPGYLTTLAVDPAETFLFVGSGKGEIYKVDLFKGGEHETEQDMANRVTVLRGHASEVTGLSLSFYGDRLVSSDIKGQCVVWNTNTCKVMTALQKNRPTCSSVAILQDPLGILPSGMLGNKPKSQFAAPIKMHGLQKTAVAEFPTQLTLFTQQPREALNRMIRPAQF